MPPLDTIVVPIDFSETSLDALRFARTIASSFAGTRLHLLHVIPDPLRQPWVPEAPGVDYLAIEDRWRTAALERLQEVARDEDLASLDVTVAVLSGSPSDAILQYAETHHANLVIMGAHGQSAVTRFFLGSVADRVVRHSHVPVLTVPRGSHSSDPPSTSSAAETETPSSSSEARS